MHCEQKEKRELQDSCFPSMSFAVHLNRQSPRQCTCRGNSNNDCAKLVGHTVFVSATIRLRTTATLPMVISTIFAMRHGLQTTMVMESVFPREPFNLPGNLGGVEIVTKYVTT